MTFKVIPSAAPYSSSVHLFQAVSILSILMIVALWLSHYLMHDNGSLSDGIGTAQKKNISIIVDCIIAVCVIAIFGIVYDVTSNFIRIKYPPSYRCALTKEKKIEVRPTSDVLKHMMLYYIGAIFGYESTIYLAVLARINAPFASWDIPFVDQGLDAAEEIRKYCDMWGMEQYDPTQRHHWKWEKVPAEFNTMNEWFMRAFDAKYSVHSVVDESVTSDELGMVKTDKRQLIVSPATSTISFFTDWRAMPRKFKNTEWENVKEIGIDERFLPHFFGDEGDAATRSSMLLYLSPADYHCFHCPVDGKIVSIFPKMNKYVDNSSNGEASITSLWMATSAMPFSVSVKEYMFRSLNILSRNRRCVLVFELDGKDRPSYVAMVIVGGLTVDSIRMDESVARIGNHVHRGQRLGGFSRGGSLIALFFSGEIVLTQKNRDAAVLSAADNSMSGYGPFKLRCGDGLGHLLVSVP